MDPPGDEIPTLYVDDDGDFVALAETLLGTDADARVGVTSVDEAVSSLRSGDVNWLVTAAGRTPEDPVRSATHPVSQTDTDSMADLTPNHSVASFLGATPSSTPLRDVVLDTSTTLMSAEPDEIETKLCWTLANVGEALGADRSYVLQFDAEREVLERTHEWTADGVDSGIEIVSAGLCEEHDWLTAQLERFQNVFVEQVCELPPDASSVQETLLAHDVRSFVAIPIIIDWTLLGAVGFDAVESDPGWQSEEIHILRTVGDMIAHTLRRRRRERELEQKNEQLEEFASVVSHDLRNPLNVVSGFLSLTRETGDLSYLTRVESAVERMDAIIENVLTLARQGEAVGEITDVNLQETLTDAWHIVDTADAKLEVVDELGSVTADRNRLSAVFENLFSNAVEHGSPSNRASPDDAVEHGSTGHRTRSDDAVEHGSTEHSPPSDELADGDSITVRVGRLPDEIGFYVEDDGPGIPVERRESVFEHGHSSDENGTGFGLAIVEQVVEAHGWSIRLTESASGGARFEVLAPLRVGLSTLD